MIWRMLLCNCLLAAVTRASVDVSVAQLQYLSSHLRQADCRRLFAALLTDTYHLDPMIAEAGLILPEDASCMEMLLHWNFSADEGRTKTHELVSRRLRQLGHVELANWLSRTVFHQLSEKIGNLEPAGGKQSAAIAGARSATTAKRLEAELEEGKVQLEEWSPFDSISFAVIICASAVLLVLMMALTVKIVAKKLKNTSANKQNHGEDIPLYEFNE